jgi:hypothetical protein
MITPMNTPETKRQKTPTKFDCEKCDFKCSKMSDWNRHTSTSKHLTIQNHTQIIQKPAVKYDCICGKSYGYSSNYYTHRKKCLSAIEKTNTAVNTTQQDNALINLVSEVVKSNNEIQRQNIELHKQTNELQKQNQEMQKQILDICKNGIINNSVTQVNSNNNKTFNLQVFLNEDCKDAMNINEFIDSIKFQLDDLEHMGQVGFVEGISNIIIKNIKALDVTKRPVHCTDQKREIIYIKDDGVWIKDDDDNKNVRKLIKRIAFRNSKCTKLYKEKYPDCIKYDSKYSNTYNQIIVEAMGGGPKSNDIENQNKIIKRIVKVMTIDKNHLS